MILDPDFPLTAKTNIVCPASPPPLVSSSSSSSSGDTQPNADLRENGRGREQTRPDSVYGSYEGLSAFEKRHCINWRTARLTMKVSHASHAKDLRETQMDNNNQKR